MRGPTSCAGRVPFVHARVVLAERPTSAHPGDEAIVLADGTMEGFVGGDCAESTVRAQALALLDSGESIVLRISPTPEEPVAGQADGAQPVPQRRHAGDLPRTAAAGAARRRPRRQPDRRGAGVDVGAASATRSCVATAPADPATAVVVASHGRDESRALTAALAAGVDYVGLVASPKRGAGGRRRPRRRGRLRSAS